MKSHQTRSTRDRSIPRSLKKVSFDEILDLTADVFSFYNIYLGARSIQCRQQSLRRTPRHVLLITLKGLPEPTIFPHLS